MHFFTTKISVANLIDFFPCTYVLFTYSVVRKLQLSGDWVMNSCSIELKKIIDMIIKELNFFQSTILQPHFCLSSNKFRLGTLKEN